MAGVGRMGMGGLGMPMMGGNPAFGNGMGGGIMPGFGGVRARPRQQRISSSNDTGCGQPSGKILQCMMPLPPDGRRPRMLTKVVGAKCRMFVIHSKLAPPARLQQLSKGALSMRGQIGSRTEDDVGGLI